MGETADSIVETKTGLGNIRALIVDDHRNMRQVWFTILSGFGIRNVEDARGAIDALQLMNSIEVDLAIVDLMLDDLSGVELISMIRKAPDSPSPTIPIIACTADTRKSTIYSLINAGADEILTKPLSTQAAWQKLMAVIYKRRSFIRAPNYVGPDRRRRKLDSYKGPERRVSFFI